MYARRFTMKFTVQNMDDFDDHWHRSEMSFQRADPILTDVVLRVANGKCDVVGVFLASHSSYFYNMFATSAHPRNNTFIVPHVTSTTFHWLLEVLHGKECINEENVENLLEASQYFGGMKPVDNKCAEFLKTTEDVPKPEKLVTAERYHLKSLTEHIINSTTSMQELKEYLPRDFSALSRTTIEAVLWKMVYF